MTWSLPTVLNVPLFPDLNFIGSKKPTLWTYMTSTQISLCTYKDGTSYWLRFSSFPSIFTSKYPGSDLYIWNNNTYRKEKHNITSLGLYHTLCCGLNERYHSCQLLEYLELSWCLFEGRRCGITGQSMSLGAVFLQTLCFLFVIGNMSSQLLLQMPATCYLSSTIMDSNLWNYKP